MVVGQNLRSELEQYKVVVVAPNERFVSTDELAAQAALEAGAERLLFFKKGVPVFHVGFPRPTRRASAKVAAAPNPVRIDRRIAVK